MLPARSSAGTAPAPGTSHDREQWAERPEQKKSRITPGPAGDSALSVVPSALLARGRQAAALSLLPAPAFTASGRAVAADLPPPRRPSSLRRPLRVCEDAARESRIGRAEGRGRVRGSSARASSRARGEQSARLAEDRQPLRRVFGLDGVAARLSVRYGPARAAQIASHPGPPPLSPHQKAGEGRRSRLLPGLWPPGRRVSRRPPPELKRK